MQKQPLLQRMVAHLAEIFVPLIPALVAGGLMLGIGNFLQANLPFLGGKSFKDVSELARVILFFTDWIGGAVFGMLPVLVSGLQLESSKGMKPLVLC